jgi:hypothetical protein
MVKGPPLAVTEAVDLALSASSSALISLLNFIVSGLGFEGLEAQGKCGYEGGREYLYHFHILY